MIYYICNRPNLENSLENHCKTTCPHGKPHRLDGCSTDEMCNVDCGLETDNSPCKKSIIVKCRPANKKELENYIIK